MVERRTTQSENVKELRFSKNIGWSQFAYLKLRKTRSGFSIPLDVEIAKVYIAYMVLIMRSGHDDVIVPDKKMVVLMKKRLHFQTDTD